MHFHVVLTKTKIVCNKPAMNTHLHSKHSTNRMREKSSLSHLFIATTGNSEISQGDYELVSNVLNATADFFHSTLCILSYSLAV